MNAHDPFGDRQAQPCTIGVVFTPSEQAIKRLEDARQLIRRHAWAMVAHYNGCLMAVERRCSLERSAFERGIREACLISYGAP
jgi:hypothetical protein